MTVVVVTKENAPQMGVITVEKTGEYLTSVIDTEDSKRLVYEVGGMAGAEYTVTAAEDIYTLDGTLRYSKDEVVATLVRLAPTRWKSMEAPLHCLIFGGLLQPALRFYAYDFFLQQQVAAKAATQ